MIYEDISKAILVSILDLENVNPISRLPTSEFEELKNVKDFIEK